MQYFIDQITHYHVQEHDHESMDLNPAVVLIHSPLAPDVMAFLEKMLTAFNWPLDHCHHIIINHEQPTANYQLLWRKKELKLVLSFGIPIAHIGLFFLAKPYTLTPIGKNMIYLADPLEKIALHKELKSKIWNDLKSFHLTEES